MRTPSGGPVIVLDLIASTGRVPWVFEMTPERHRAYRSWWDWQYLDLVQRKTCPLATPCQNVRICSCGVDNRTPTKTPNQGSDQ